MKESIRLVDVGARSGIHERWKPFYGQIEVRGFEPDPEECAALNAKTFPYKVEYIPTALGAKNGEEATLHITKQPGCSSLLKPNLELCTQYPYGWAMEVVDTYPVTLNRMDSVCSDFQPDVLKVDTQGTELDVLRGAGQLLDDMLAVELEVEFVPQYIGQPLFSDVDLFMREQGFMLRGLRRTFWRTKADHVHAGGGQLFHGDALYLRPSMMNTPKGHIILAAYRQYDLLANYGATQFIPKRSPLERAIATLMRPISTRKARQVIDRFGHAKATAWHDPEFF